MIHLSIIGGKKAAIIPPDLYKEALPNIEPNAN